ncbi:hypothetical protein C3B47_11880 [Flavobacterium columnare]|uniref:hypothetical protein n=1 Tax=Flavobacterium columnare TaxID=996 RepID=UPI000F511C93|nr:hypothetical protein [Flavobacterium columnare]MBF6653575.1 hypothetical protein [Flavobacterium columnare]MBF6657188.1 hypothetical protein [Flavobacterium columnare]
MQTKVNLRLIILKSLLLLGIKGTAQTIDLGAFQGKPLKIGGSASVGSTFSESNRDSRAPFIYNFTGNLNVSLYSFSMPITYNFSNMGGKLSYQVPFNFNRLSLNPRYKWISVLIGDASMTFSPYSLAGHMFTGGGIELTPDGPIKISAMYGRLLKEVNDIHNPNSLPVFERWGYGTKIELIKNKYKLGFIGFYAKDKENPLLYQSVAPNVENLSPKENLVIGLNFETQVSKEAKIYGDYTNSSLIQDVRSTGKSSPQGVASLLLKGNASTQNFNAFKLGFDYKIQKMMVGASFERIDPGYQTMGAYFFSNDLQNIMINASRPLFNDKVQLTMNLGIQKDNLDHKKAQTTNRFVGTVNTNIKINEKLSTNLSLTNQSTTTNVNPDQFVQINQNNPAINAINQLNYRQLSNSLIWNANYQLPESKQSKRNCSFNYNYNEVENEQGGQISPNQKTAIHNLNALYTHFLMKTKWAFNTSLNYTISQITGQNIHTFGPVLGISKKYFKDKLTTQWATSYNSSKSPSSNAHNFNCRFNATYKMLEEHNFNFMVSQLIANSSNASTSNSINDLTITIGYNFNFAGTKKKQKEEEEKKVSLESLEKPKITLNISGISTDLDSKAIGILIEEKNNAIDFEGLEPLQEILSIQKKNLQENVSKYDQSTDPKEKNKIEKTIKKEFHLWDLELQKIAAFNDLYKESKNKAFSKIKEEIKENLSVNKKHLKTQYKSEFFKEDDEDSQGTFLAFEEEMIKQKAKPTPKDLFAMAQISLYFQLENLDWNNSYNKTLINVKNQYYQQFKKAKEPLGIVEALVVKGIDTYVKKYKEKFKK